MVLGMEGHTLPWPTPPPLRMATITTTPILLRIHTSYWPCLYLVSTHWPSAYAITALIPLPISHRIRWYWGPWDEGPAQWYEHHGPLVVVVV